MLRFGSKHEIFIAHTHTRAHFEILISVHDPTVISHVKYCYLKFES